MPKREIVVRMTVKQAEVLLANFPYIDPDAPSHEEMRTGIRSRSRAISQVA